MVETEGFSVTRDVNAPRALVFQAWTDPDFLKHWWGPKGFAWSTCTLDLRPGGVFHYGLKAPDGRALWGKFVYREVMAPERLTFLVSFSDDQGGIVRHPMNAAWPLEVLNTLTLTEQDGWTTLTLHAIPINASAAECKTFADGRDGLRQGFAGTLDQLAAYLAKA